MVSGTARTGFVAQEDLLALLPSFILLTYPFSSRVQLYALSGIKWRVFHLCQWKIWSSWNATNSCRRHWADC